MKSVSQREGKTQKSYDLTQATLRQHPSTILHYCFPRRKNPGTHVTLRVLEALHKDGGHLLYALGHLHLYIFQLKQIIKRKDWDDGLRISPKKLLSSTSIFAGGRVLSSRIPIEGLSTLGTIVSHSNKSNLQLSNVRHQ